MPRFTRLRAARCRLTAFDSQGSEKVGEKYIQTRAVRISKSAMVKNRGSNFPHRTSHFFSSAKRVKACCGPYLFFSVISCFLFKRKNRGKIHPDKGCINIQNFAEHEIHSDFYLASRVRATFSSRPLCPSVRRRMMVALICRAALWLVGEPPQYISSMINALL